MLNITCLTYTIYVKYIEKIIDITQIKHYLEDTLFPIVYTCLENTLAVLVLPYLLLHLLNGWLFNPDPHIQLGGQDSCILFQSVNVPGSPP